MLETAKQTNPRTVKQQPLSAFGRNLTRNFLEMDKILQPYGRI